jgi:PhnB protein
MKATSITPYLSFGGRCQEALDFYKSALGAEVEMVMYFKDSPEPAPPGMLSPGWEDKVMHASIRIGGILVMADDGCGPSKGFEGFSLHFALDTEADVTRIFSTLAEKGAVGMPLGKTFWSPMFGMVTDLFGVTWMISLAECAAV